MASERRGWLYLGLVTLIVAGLGALAVVTKGTGRAVAIGLIVLVVIGAFVVLIAVSPPAAVIAADLRRYRERRSARHWRADHYPARRGVRLDERTIALRLLAPGESGKVFNLRSDELAGATASCVVTGEAIDELRRDDIDLGEDGDGSVSFPQAFGRSFPPPAGNYRVRWDAPACGVTGLLDVFEVDAWGSFVTPRRGRRWRKFKGFVRHLSGSETPQGQR